MAKQKIHELAKELEVPSKIIVDYMNKKQKQPEKKYTPSNALEADEVAEIRANIKHPAGTSRSGSAEGKPAENRTSGTKNQEGRPANKASGARAQEGKPADTKSSRQDTDNRASGGKGGQAKPADAKSGDGKGGQAKSADGKPVSKEGAARPKKKASITAVFNAQYSKQGNRKPRGKGTGERRQRNNFVRPAEKPHIPIRPNADRPNYDRASAHVPDDEVVKPPQEKRPATNRNNAPSGRPQSERGNNSRNTNHGRPAGGGQQRTGGQGGRPDRGQNDRGGRNAGFEQKGEKSYQNNRTNSGNNYGDKNNSRVGKDRQKEFKGRPDQEMNRFHKDTAAKTAPEELRKESRDNNRKKNNTNREYDKLGGKKQERYINLEKTSGHKKKNQTPAQAPAKEEDVIKTITLPDHMMIRELADKLKIQPSVIVKKLFLKGTMVTVNQDVTYEQAEEIALEFNYIAEPEEKIDVIAELLKEEEEDESKMVSRPPVICVMGHVDHGKTSLLDAIRNTRVTDKEAGGITQAIGAYTVTCKGENITFLDTPGHEAFTAMRMRGANSTDIAILVVAADDGVMPQTVEAINHAKAAGIEIIVAVNKIDKQNANVDRVKQELSEYELIPEDWGGSTIFVPVSAHTHEGIEQLLEMILLTAEVLELKANPKRNARGVVIEAKLDKGRGAVATVLVQKGTLKVGQPVACGSSYGKVRAMIDDKGRNVKDAKPSMPVEILGLSSVPDAGETFVVCASEKDARGFSETYIAQSKEKLLEETRSRMSLDDLFSQIQSGNVKELNIIVKADVQGSVEAVKQSLVKLSNEEVVVKIIHGGVGAVNESDVNLASASNAIIIGFNVRPDVVAKTTAEREGVDVRLYKVIYNAIEDVSAAMKGMLDPVFEEKVIGHAEIRQIFKASGVGNIAGSYVLDGILERGCKCRITREGSQIFEGSLASLKRFKDDVKEVRTGYECGLVFEGFDDLAELDVIEAYKMVEVPR